jgi:hypothetical protein
MTEKATDNVTPLPGLAKEPTLEGNANLRVVDEHGELCPGCDERDAKIRALRTEKNGWRVRFQNLERKVNVTKGPHWVQAELIFNYWRDKTGHSRAKFTHDRKRLLEPFIEREGIEECKRAVDGRLASDWHMKRGRYAKRDGPIHDRLEQIFGSQESFEVATGVMDEREQPTLEEAPAQQTTLAPASIVQAIRSRVFLLELEEDEDKRRKLLEEIGQLAKGERLW